MSVLTYVDAGVLISAATGRDDVFQQAMAVLDDPNRKFASSAFVRLEVLPKAVYGNRNDEIQFYEEFFQAVTKWADDNNKIVKNAHSIAAEHGMGAVDALHVSAARLTGALEIFSGEKPTKPLFRASVPRAVSIRAT